MENAIQGAQRSDDRSGEQGVKLTSLGWLLLIIVVAGGGFAGWTVWQQHSRELTALEAQEIVTHEKQLHAGAAPKATSGASALLTSSAVAQQQAAMTPGIQVQAPASPRSAQVSEQISAMRRENLIVSAAARAANDAQRQKLAELESKQQDLEAKIDALPKATSTARVAHDSVADSAKNVRKGLEAAKATASIDVASLPIETVTAQALNVTGFGDGVVGIGAEKLSVGQPFQQGETIVAIDAKTQSIVTNRRIINVTN